MVFAAALVFVVGGDIAQGGVQAAGVVVAGSGVVELCGRSVLGSVMVLEVGPFGLDVAEQGLDPCLVRGQCRAGRGVSPRFGEHGEELPGGA